MDYKIITCKCGNTYSRDIWEGKCCVCGRQEKPQNLPKADAYSLLAEVRALRPDMDGIKYFIDVMDRPSAEQSIEMVKYIEALEQFVNEHFS